MEKTFKNEFILPNDLPSYTPEVFHKIDPKYWRLILINLAIIGILLSIGAVLFTRESAMPEKYKITIICLAYSIYGILIWLNRKSFLNRGYLLREKDILYKSGYLIENTLIVPINRIQHIAVEEGVFLRMYELANLVIHTAAVHGGPLQIKGLPKELAFQIKANLLQKTTQEQIPSEIES